MLCFLATFLLYCSMWKKRILRGSHREYNMIGDKLYRCTLLFAMLGPWMLHFRRWFVWVPSILYAATFLDGSEISGGRPSRVIFAVWCAVSRMWHGRVHSRLEVEKPPALQPMLVDGESKPAQFVFALHPHGALPISAIMQFASEDWDSTLPVSVHREKLRVLVASFCFHIPVLRDFYLGAGFVDAAKFSARAVLDQGRSIMIFPGGASEAKFCGPHTDALVLHSRTGFVRLALERGLALVPCFTFGETDVLPFASGVDIDSSLFQFQSSMQKLIGLNVDPRMPLVPIEDYPVWTVVGTPLVVPQIEHPSEEDVQLWLGNYIRALSALHQTHQPLYQRHLEKHLQKLQKDGRTPRKPLEFVPVEDSKMP